MNSDTLNCLWILIFPIGIIEISTSRKCLLLLNFISFTITDHQALETNVTLIYISLFNKKFNRHTTKEFNFFRIIYVAMSNNQFSDLDNVKMTSQTHKYSGLLQNFIRKPHVYIDIGRPWIWNQCFYLGIWNDDRTKIIVLPSFQLATRLNSQSTNET